MPDSITHATLNGFISHTKQAVMTRFFYDTMYDTV